MLFCVSLISPLNLIVLSLSLEEHYDELLFLAYFRLLQVFLLPFFCTFWLIDAFSCSHYCCSSFFYHNALIVYQVNGCLSYSDKVPDGFYLIHGMNPYVWTVCTDLLENGRIPTIESLKSVDPSTNSSMEVVLIDRRSDPSLKEFQNRVLGLSHSCITTKEVVDQLAKLVCNLMGYVSSF